MTPRMATKPKGAPLMSSAAAGCEHQHRLAEVLQLRHQQDDDDEQHDRRLGGDRCLALGTVFRTALDLDLVVRGETVPQPLKFVIELQGHVIRLDTVRQRCAHGYGRLAIAPPFDALFHDRNHLGHLGHRHEAAEIRRHIDRVDG